MNFIKRLIILIGIIHAAGMYGMNVVRPYQILLRPPKLSDSWMQVYAIGQFGFASRAFSDDGDVPSALQIYECNQSGIAMLDGFSPCSDIGQLRVRLDANDDCVRGHFQPCGQLDVDTAMHFGLRFFFEHHLSLAFYLPFYKMALKDVVWQNLTQGDTIQDARTCSYLADCLCQRMRDLGCLDIGGWQRTGVGDTTVSLEWIRDYPQQKPFLHNVTINGRLGFTLPSGLKADEDKLLAFPFGNDGSTGLIFALGLDLYMGQYMRGGLDVQLMHVFGNTRCRRIKTDVAQTNLFLLAKTDAFKDFGLTQQFSFYWEFYKLLYGASFKVAYQFYKNGEDTLYLTSNEFSSIIANSAQSNFPTIGNQPTGCSGTLNSFTTHDVFIILNYDFSDHMSEDSRWAPYVSAFVDIPFNGKRSVVVKNAGFAVALNF